MLPSNERRRLRVSLRRAGAFALAALTALATLAFAAPAAEAEPQIRVDQRRTGQPLQVIALQARVTDLDDRRTLDYELVPAEHVQLVEGDRVRVNVIGTAIVNGDGVARDIPVRLELAAGSRYVDVTVNRDGSAIVVANAIPAGEYGADGLVRSQLAFQVVGDYDMRDNLRSGRITFEIRPANGVVNPPVTGGGVRWDRAVAIADEIAEVRVVGEGTPNWVVQRIYENGYQGARDSALELAVQAERTGTFRRLSAEAVTAHLYRHLLGRGGSDREIALSDPTGFNANVRIFQQRGYRELVDVFVQSEEFRRHHDFARLETTPLPREERPGRVLRRNRGRGN
jgi:hypothetical protein